MTVNKDSIQFFRIFTDIIILSLIFIIVLYTTHPKIELDLPLLNFLLVILIAWLFGGKVSYLYDDFRSRTFTYQLMSIFRNSIILLIVMLFVFFLFKNQFLSRPRVFIVSFSLFCTIIISLKEYLLRHFFASLRKKGINIRNLAIVGINKTGFEFNKLVKNYPHFGYNILGFIGETSHISPSTKILGQISDLDNILTNNTIHEVIITLSFSSSVSYNEIIRTCNKHAVKVKIIPDYMKFLSKKFKTTTFGEFPIITVRTEPLEEVQWRILKRGFDIVFSSFVILFFLSWLFPIIFIFQKLSSKGPVFFVQDRIGRNGKIIKVYKFRTMYVNSDIKFNPILKDDPRVTKLGRFLRKTNIDELPQFFNVFIGNMSIVGPRPHAISFEKKYSEFVEEIKMRHSVKPGITGWAQVNGLRGDAISIADNRVHTSEKISYDLWYIENWSFVLDIQIILMTVWNMIKGDPNAY